jgi:hypothetical protein
VQWIKKPSKCRRFQWLWRVFLLTFSEILIALLTTAKAWALPLLPFDSAKFGGPSWMSGRHSGVSVELRIRIACREVTALPPLLLVSFDWWWRHALILLYTPPRFGASNISQIFLNVYFFVLWELPNTEIKIRCLFHPRSLLGQVANNPPTSIQTVSAECQALGPLV